MIPRETVYFPESPSFPKDQTLGSLFSIWTFPSTIAAKHPEQATTAELYPVRDTFEFDQGHLTKSHPVTVLFLLSGSLGI